MDNLQVNHIDGNKLNNNLSNLEWVTGKENTLHAHKLGLCKPQYGEYNPCSKLKEYQVKEIIDLLLSHKYTYEQIAKKYGVNTETIGDIKRKRRWKYLTKNIKF